MLATPPEVAVVPATARSQQSHCTTQTKHTINIIYSNVIIIMEIISDVVYRTDRVPRRKTNCQPQSSAAVVVAHLNRAGSSVAHLNRAGSSVAHLNRAGSSVAHLKRARSSVAHLNRAGSSAAHLDRAGSSVAPLDRAGISAAHLDRAK